MTHLFLIPYDSGQRGVRMGAGPMRIAEELGMPFEVVETERAFPLEVGTTFDLYRRIAERIRESDDFPVVLSGNCGVSNGVIAGLGVDDLAVLWFDAHGEYMTPETTISGFLDGMGLSIMTGRCWKRLAATIPWFRPLPVSRTLLVGSRDYSPGERDELLADGVPLAEPSGLRHVGQALDAMRLEASRILIHVDLDVLDPRFGRANEYAADGGLSPDDILRVIEIAAGRFTVAGLVVASYDPGADPEGRVAGIGARIVTRLAAS
jgi:arginase